MYFDFKYYRSVLAFTWKHTAWPKRNKMLFKLLVLTPILTVINAICFLLDYVFFPRLWAQKVETPVFIVGHARSGTTLMHRLMAADGGRFSYFYYWEMFFPSLTQRAVVKAIGWLDRTLFGRAIENKVQAWDEKTFGPTRHIHKQGLWIPEEDQFVMKNAFLTQQWAVDMPLMHQVDLFHIDDISPKRKKRWMHHYKECVKRQLLANGGNEIHLSKNPMMCGWVNALLETFPDAKIIVLVRDPISCVPSALKMMEGSWKYKKWSKTEYTPALEAMTQISFDSYNLPVEALAKHPSTPHYIVDYRDLTTAPKKTVEAAYAALGLTLSDEYSNYLASQEEREKKHESKFKYDIKNFAITPAEIEDRLDGFYEQYKWPRPSLQPSAAEE